MNIRMLKKKLRSSKKKENLHGKLTIVTMILFPGIEVNDDTSCLDCRDYKNQTCSGENRTGFAVLDCMKKKINSGDFEFGSS